MDRRTVPVWRRMAAAGGVLCLLAVGCGSEQPPAGTTLDALTLQRDLVGDETPTLVEMAPAADGFVACLRMFGVDAGDAERDEGLFSFRVSLPPWPTGWLALESFLSDWKDCGDRHVGMVSLERTGEEDPVGQPQSDSDYYEAILAGAGRLDVELEGNRTERLDALITGHPFVHDFCLRLVSLQCDHIGSAPHHLPACGDFRT